MSCGIYKIENNINHHVYIGQSTNIEQRWARHKRMKEDYTIYQAFKKYGIENFTFSIIEECSVEQLDEREIYWIKQYDSYHNGYNETLGGQGAHGNSVKLSYDQVQEIRQLLKTTDKTCIEIGEVFNVSENTIISINTGQTWREDNIDYPIRKKPVQNNQIYYCKRCGVPLKTASNHCPQCAAILQRKVERPTKEELFKILKDNNGNFTAVGQMFGVIDNTIRKWCKSYNIPFHSSDYKTAKEKKGQSLPAVTVQQINKKTGEVIQEFSSIAEAERITGIYHITEASDPNNTSRKSAGGFIWKRK